MGDGTGRSTDLDTFNLADVWEAIAERVPEREALVCGGRRLTYAQLDERANRLANHLRSAGVGAGAHVGLYLMNGTEYVEGMLAAFKLRAVPVNVNYRYVAAELRYLLDDAGVAALIHHRRFTPHVAQIRADLPAWPTWWSSTTTPVSRSPSATSATSDTRRRCPPRTPLPSTSSAAATTAT